jgi:hypothetical protein
MQFVIEFQSWRWIIVALSPFLDLFNPIFFRCLCFVPALESSVMSLVDFPMLDDLNIIFLSHLLEDEIQCFGGSTQQ